MPLDVDARLPAAPTDFIWLATGFIGDVLLATAALELAAKTWPQVAQRVVTTPVGAKVLAGSPAVAQVVVFDKAGRGALAAFRQVRRALGPAVGGRPVVLQAHTSFRSGFLCRYLGYPTVNFREADWGWHAAVRVPRVATLHEAARIGMLLTPFGVGRAEIVAARPRLAALPLVAADGGGGAAWREQLAAFAGPVVGVAPGSVWGTKRWTPAGFVALVQRLLARRDVLVVLIGSEAERPLAESIASAAGDVGSERLLNLAGQTTLDDLRRVMPRCAVLVANDSSPIHYASAFGVPTVALFGATVPGMGFGPLAPNSVTLGTALPCRPCSDHGPQTCPLGHFRCMRELRAEAVYAACAALLPAAPAGL